MTNYDSISGLSNSVLFQDIGTSMMEKTVGNTIADLHDYSISGAQHDMRNIDIKKELKNDKFENSARKNNSVTKGILITLGSILILFGAKKLGAFKKLKSLGEKIPGAEKLKNFFGKILKFKK